MRYLALRFAPVLMCVGILVAGAVVTGWATPADTIKVTFDAFGAGSTGTTAGGRIRTNTETQRFDSSLSPKLKPES